nr:hypothetical protein [Mycobacterium sp.]
RWSHPPGNQAVPSPWQATLAHDVIRLADTYEDILLRLLADATDSDLSGLYESVDRSVPVVVQACK